MHQPANHSYEFGPFQLEQAERRLLRAGEPVPLTAKVFDLLLILVQNHGHLLEKDELLQAVWGDNFVEEGNLTRSISTLRKALGEDDGAYIETVPKRGYRFVARVHEWPGVELMVREHISASIIIEEEEAHNNPRIITHNPQPLPRAADGFTAPREHPEPVGGAVPLDSRFYLERSTDTEFQQAVARRDSIVLVKGARQVGKTSLLARSLQTARSAGARVVFTDFQLLNTAQLASVEALFLALAKSLAEQLELALSPKQVWDAELGPSMNFTRYVRHEVLGRTSAPLVWGLDEVDRLFTCAFGGEVFGLLRSWHNARSLDPAGPWQRLTLALAYATEAHLFITDLHQSPFNVGTRLALADFTLEQVAELNYRYGSPLDAVEVERFFGLVGGHPYLVRCGLHELAVQGTSLAALSAQAEQDEGPFGDHLRRLLISLHQDAALCAAVRDVLAGAPCPTAESFYRLRSAGVLAGDSARAAQLRCQLYARYLKGHLL